MKLNLKKLSGNNLSSFTESSLTESIPRSYNSKQLLMEWEVGENSVR